MFFFACKNNGLCFGMVFVCNVCVINHNLGEHNEFKKNGALYCFNIWNADSG